jgi:HSP20 family protein
MSQNSQLPQRPDGLTERLRQVTFDPLRRDLHRLFDDIFDGRFHGVVQVESGQRGPIMPNIDITETEGEVRVRAELPGVNDGDIDVSLDDDILIIRGEKKFDKADDKESYHFIERLYGAFQRAIQLPCSVDPDKVKADFHNGVLTVTLPKVAEVKKSRKIEVQSGAAPAAVPSAEHAGSGSPKPAAPTEQPSGSGAGAGPEKK